MQESKKKGNKGGGYWDINKWLIRVDAKCDFLYKLLTIRGHDTYCGLIDDPKNPFLPIAKVRELQERKEKNGRSAG